MAETTTIAIGTAVLQIPTTLKSLIEGLIFAAHEPLTVKQIQTLYEYDGVDAVPRKLAADEVESIVKELNDEYHAFDRPYRIIHIAGGYQFATLQKYAEWLGKLYKEQSRRKLSQSAVESLAIIAYKQPISKPEIESIRGVNCDYVLRTLLEKELVTIVGRAPTPGRPLLYGTTRDFLKHFGLNEITDLPRPREIEEILGESQFETERRMLEAQQGIQDQVKEEENFKSRLPHIPKRKPELDNEVKIVPHRKTRQMKVQHSEETAADQTQLELTPLQAEGSTEIQKSQLPSSGEMEDFSRSGEPPLVQEGQTKQEEPQLAHHPPILSSVEEEITVEDRPVMEQESLIAADHASGQDSKPGFEKTHTLQSIEGEAHSDVKPEGVIDSAIEATATEISQYTNQPDTPDQQQTPNPKSRWQTWKEKIQGFIKKLFD
ncbi:MAG: SMC-Scp complex subunit ScpB [bacterium]